MKTFCTVFVIMLAMCLCLAILAGVSYLDTHGPDWLAARTSTVTQANGTTITNYGSTPPAVVLGALLGVVAVITCAVVVVFDIQDM